MLKLSILFVILASVVCTTYGYGWQPGGAVCGCFNPVKKLNFELDFYNLEK